MKRFWRATFSVVTGSAAGLAFYQNACNLVYFCRHTSHIAPGDLLFTAICLLTLPVTAAATLGIHTLIKRAFGPR